MEKCRVKTSDTNENVASSIEIDTELAYIKTILPLTNHSKNECLHMIGDVVQIFLRSCQDPKNKHEHLIETLKVLKSSCVKGVEFQEMLATNRNLLDAVDKFLAVADSPRFYLICVSASQLIANLCVHNVFTQKLLWERFQNRLLEGLNADTKISNIWAMVAYNIRINEANQQLLASSYQVILSRILLRITNEQELPEFVNLLLEFYITRGKETVDLYQQLNENEKIALISYIADFVKDELNKSVEENLLCQLIFDFVSKSDAILQPQSKAIANPKEIYGLLEIIAYTSCNQFYTDILNKDSSLFLNLGCLLVAVHEVGLKKNNIFSPIQKLDKIVASSNEDTQHEQDISFCLKTLLVKAVGNLMYKNKKNQDLVREMKILHTILECTNIDARNPLIKEYSILAIHNACDDNDVNQEFIASLVKVGNVSSEIVSEYTNNTVRIQKSV